jgi:uncharacterized protein YkwD
MIIKKTVPNVPLVREKPDEEIVTGEIGDEGEQEIKEEAPTKLKSGANKNFRSRIQRNQPFTLDTGNGSSKSESTERKPDGSIVRTIVEINGNQKKTTTITTKGNSTSTNTKIETIRNSGSNNQNRGNTNNNFSNWGFGNFDDINKMWNDQINQMNKNMQNYGGGGWSYQWESNTNNNNNNKKNTSQWGYDWGDISNNNNKKNTNQWGYEWGDIGGSNNNKNISQWGYDWGDSGSNKKKESEKKVEIISGNDFQQNALDTHNKYRQKHHVGNLVLSKDLCNIAQKYAESLARTGNFAHSGDSYNGNPMGENLFACYGMKITGKTMTDDWYNEINDYNFNRPGFTSGTGHFTQVVWKGSKQVGFGYAQARDGYYYGVANYYPAGNYMNEFEDNVFPA